MPKAIFTALSSLVPLPVDEDEHCVIATTVARMGGSLYVHLRQGVCVAEEEAFTAAQDAYGACIAALD